MRMAPEAGPTARTRVSMSPSVSAMIEELVDQIEARFAELEARWPTRR